MRRVLLLTVAVCALGGCKKTKRDRCSDAWDRQMAMIKEMARAFGGSDVSASELPGEKEKKAFVDACVRFDDDAIECVENPDKDGCDEIMAKAQEAIPVEKAALAWETAPVADKRATARVPKGWRHDDALGDAWSAPDNDVDLGVSSSEISNTCGGDCTKQPAAEWARRVEENEVTNLETDGGGDVKIERDEKLGDTGRLIVAENRATGVTQIEVYAFFWQDGGESYYVCKAELDHPLSANVDDFVDACKALKIDSYASTFDDDSFDDDDDDDDGDAGAK